MIKKILIANPGKIAARILRACHEPGISAAVWSILSLIGEPSMFVMRMRHKERLSNYSQDIGHVTKI